MNRSPNMHMTPNIKHYKDKKKNKNSSKMPRICKLPKQPWKITCLWPWHGRGCWAAIAFNAFGGHRTGIPDRWKKMFQVFVALHKLVGFLKKLRNGTGGKSCFKRFGPATFLFGSSFKWRPGLKTNWTSIEIVTENSESVKFNRTRNGKNGNM